jgi:hypothetical protein
MKKKKKSFSSDFLQNKKIKKGATPVRFELTHALHTALAGPRLNHSAKVPLLSKVELLKYINIIYVVTVMEEIPYFPSCFQLKRRHLPPKKKKK